MVTVLGANTLSSGGFQVANSYRGGTDDHYLVRDKVTPTAVVDFTFSVWVKRSKIADKSCILSAWGGDGNNTGSIFFTDGDKLTFEGQTGGSYSANGGVRKITTQLFRDVSGWSHLVFQKDDGVFKIYHNGTEITAFDTNTQSSGTNIFNNASGNTTVGNENLAASDHDFQGYIAEAVFIDGQALAPTSFGEFDDSGIWKPIDVSGLTFGNNGFYLDFEDSSAMGNDATGGTDFTLQNVAAIDQSTDTCTNNFATFNPLAAGSGVTFAEGNLAVGSGTNGTNNYSASTIGVNKGKWYLECITAASTKAAIGIVFDGNSGNVFEEIRSNRHAGNNGTGWAYKPGNSGTVEHGGANISYSSATADENNVIGIALDLDNDRLYFSKDGTFLNSGNTQNATGAIDISDRVGNVFISIGSTDTSSSTTTTFNFGSPPYSESGGETDGDGFGNFNQAVPSGYFALCTKNLAEYG